MRTSKAIEATIIFTCVFATEAWASKKELYGERICHQTCYVCLEARHGESWESLWPDVKARDMVMKINRRNMKLRVGMILAVPPSLAVSAPIDSRWQMSLSDFSPFVPEDLRGRGTKLAVFDPRLLAWAAYNQSGRLTRWGPASGGSDWCDDIKRMCHTPTGVFKIEKKYGPKKRSNLFPLGCRGITCAAMPYFMKFDRFGAGFHGSPYVPGFNDSHGCVRLFPEDAELLNKEFAEIGTIIIVLPY